MAERLTIDELARRAGMTVRNVRAYQSRGLLPPPELMGRTGYYGPEHVARLKLIKEMQGSGFNLAAIKWLLDAAPAGSGAELLEFQRELLRPWQSEQPRVFEATELAGWFGGNLSPEAVERAVRLGLIAFLDDGRVEVKSPSLLRAGAEVVALDVPLERVEEVFEELVRHSRSIARSFIELFVEEVWRPAEASSETDWPRVREALERLRPVASEALMSVFRMTMTTAVEEALGQELEARSRERDQAS